MELKRTPYICKIEVKNMAESKNDKEEKDRQKKAKALVKELETQDPEKLKVAIKALKIYGDSKTVKPILDRWIVGVNDEAEKEIQVLLNDIKQSDSSTPVMEAVNDTKYLSIRRALLTTIWNTKVDYSEYLVDFVNIAVDGDFMDALECLTIIENLEGPFDEHQFLDAQVALSEFADLKDKTSKKAKIISEIAIIIKDLEANHVVF